MLPTHLYQTKYGNSYIGDAAELLTNLPDGSVDLIVTSPPFALQRKKEYGNKDQMQYVDWLCSFAPEIVRVLKETGSFVLDLGGAYQKGRPIRSLYNFRVLLCLCDTFGFRLAEEFFWYNPAKLPSPIEWVNKRKLRAKDAVDTVWWLSKSDFPKADISKVLTPYSDRMKKLMENPEKFYKPAMRPSGHNIANKFGNANNGGAIPSNLLQISNTESNSQYLRLCKQVGIKAHPARFPEKLPAFFIKYLTDPDDLVLDIFAGSNTTGLAAEKLARKWIAFEQNKEYLASSVFRFIEPPDFTDAKIIYKDLLNNPQLGFQVARQESLF